MTRHQRKMLKKQRQEKVGAASGGEHIGKKRIVGFLGVLALMGAGIYGIRYLKATTPETLYTADPVHWHAKFEVELCGKKQDFSSYGEGSSHAGSSLLHTHGDEIIHIEGQVIQRENITLGSFFDNIDVPFDRDRIMDKKNGNECSPGKPGQVKMFVNDKPNDEFRNYTPFATEKAEEDRIKIIFE